MRTAKVLGIAAIFAGILLAGTSFAEKGNVIEGSLSAFYPDRNVIVLETMVPGIMGSEAKEVPFVIDPNKTTFSICVNIAGECYRNLDAKNGWQTLESLEKITSFSVLDKKVKLTKNLAGDISHVDIVYTR